MKKEEVIINERRKNDELKIFITKLCKTFK